MIEQARERFETWVKSSESHKVGDLDTRDHDDQPYANHDMQLDWQAWQACELSLKQRHDDLQEQLKQAERRMQDAVDALNADTAQELSFKHAAKEAERNRDDMKEKWDYYQAFVKAQGANSITDLASRHNKMLALLEKIHLEAYGGELSSDTWDEVDSLVAMYAKPKEVV